VDSKEWRGNKCRSKTQAKKSAAETAVKSLLADSKVRTLFVLAGLEGIARANKVGNPASPPSSSENRRTGSSMISQPPSSTPPWPPGNFYSPADHYGTSRAECQQPQHGGKRNTDVVVPQPQQPQHDSAPPPAASALRVQQAGRSTAPSDVDSNFQPSDVDTDGSDCGMQLDEEMAVEIARPTDLASVLIGAIFPSTPSDLRSTASDLFYPEYGDRVW
jgi:hypothetical protein